MCQFFSAIITKDDILWDKFVDSHEILLFRAGILDDLVTPDFVRVELLPSKTIFCKDLSKWLLNVDQDIVPDWFIGKKHIYADKLREILKGFYNEVVFDSHCGVKIYEGRVFTYNSSVMVYGNSCINAYGTSKVVSFDRGYINACNHTRVELYNRSTCNGYHFSFIEAFGKTFSHLNHSSKGNFQDDSSVELCDFSYADMRGDSNARLLNVSTCNGHDNSVIYKVSNKAIAHIEDNSIIYDQSQEPYRIIVPRDTKYLLERGESCKNNWE